MLGAGLDPQPDLGEPAESHLAVAAAVATGAAAAGSGGMRMPSRLAIQVSASGWCGKVLMRLNISVTARFF